MSTSIVRDRYTDTAIAKTYDTERFASWIGWAFDRLEKRAIRKVVRGALALTSDRSALDVPCGTGRITELLLELGLDVTGGDISTAMLEEAERKCRRFARTQWRRLDLDALDVPNDSYGLVSCIRLFHHLGSPDRAAVLSELARVSRRYVLVNVAYSSRWYRLRRRLKRLMRQGCSRTSSTHSEVMHEARTAGLRLEKQRFVLPLISEDLILLFRKI